MRAATVHAPLDTRWQTWSDRSGGLSPWVPSHRELGGSEPCYPLCTNATATRRVAQASTASWRRNVKLAPLGELLAKWSLRRDVARELAAVVPLDRVCDEVIADLGALDEAYGQELLTLSEAAEESGYSQDHLRRLIREGKLTNAGRHHAPLVRRADLPRKPGHLRSGRTGINNAAPSREQIVRAVVTSDMGAIDGQDT